MDIETLSIGNYTQLCTVVRSLCIVCATLCTLVFDSLSLNVVDIDC